MQVFLADAALLPSGWAGPVRLAVADEGSVAEARSGDGEGGGERIGGVVLPGVPNLHSHAFQRALAGLAERAGPAADSFWTWRQVMYRFVARLTPADVHAIACQLYVEMLKAGYTAVAEFHYLHLDPAGRPYEDPAEMSRAIVAAARRTGIGLTLLPVLYTAGGFDGRPVGEAQRRFALDVDAFLALVETLRREEGGQVRVGAAAHSLRAVPPGHLAACLAGLERIAPGAPFHIHVAEQPAEVAECRARTGARPVEWLLANAPVSERWCLVHATHAEADELAGVAESGAVAGLCPTTEANLGDGIFPLADYLERGGRFGVGSDSHVSVSPAEELRWLEYGQRLMLGRRNVAAAGEGESTGARLYRLALAGGARASGRPLGAIEAGRRADLVVLDPDHPVLAGRRGDRLLDAYVFCGNGTPVRDVMVGGQWVVRDGRHAGEEEIGAAYRETVARLMDGD